VSRSQPRPTVQVMDPAQQKNRVDTRLMHWSCGVSLDLSMTTASVPQTPMSPSIYGFPQLPCSPRAPTPTQQLNVAAKQWPADRHVPTPQLPLINDAALILAASLENLESSTFPHPVPRPEMQGQELLAAGERKEERLKERKRLESLI